MGAAAGLAGYGDTFDGSAFLARNGFWGLEVAVNEGETMINCSNGVHILRIGDVKAKCFPFFAKKHPSLARRLPPPPLEGDRLVSVRSPIRV
jgi:hypothetical protein